MINLFKTIKNLKSELSRVKEQNATFIKVINSYKEEVENLRPTASKVIEKMLGRNLNWFDVSKLSIQQRKDYYKEAQDILRSQVFINEYKMFILDLTKYLSHETTNWEETVQGRYTLNGLETFRERLEDIVEPDEEAEITRDEELESI